MPLQNPFLSDETRYTLSSELSRTCFLNSTKAQLIAELERERLVIEQQRTKEDA